MTARDALRPLLGQIPARPGAGRKCCGGHNPQDRCAPPPRPRERFEPKPRWSAETVGACPLAESRWRRPRKAHDVGRGFSSAGISTRGGNGEVVLLRDAPAVDDLPGARGLPEPSCSIH